MLARLERWVVRRAGRRVLRGLAPMEGKALQARLGVPEENQQFRATLNVIGGKLEKAEARVMARSTPDSYFAWVDKLCTGKLPAPVTATTPVPAPASR